MDIILQPSLEPGTEGKFCLYDASRCIVTQWDLDGEYVVEYLAQKAAEQSRHDTRWKIKKLRSGKTADPLNSQLQSMVPSFGLVVAENTLRGGSNVNRFPLPPQATELVTQMLELKGRADALDQSPDYTFETWGKLWDQIHALKFELMDLINAMYADQLPPLQR